MVLEVIAVERQEPALAVAPVDDFESFARRVHVRAVTAVAMYCGDAEVAQEATQEALAKALLNWDRVRAAESPDAYLIRSAMNEATRWYRRLRTRRKYAAAEGKVETVTLVEQADGIAVRQVLATLPDRQRQALLLRYFSDFSVAETAAAMDCAEGTVRALASQGVEAMRRQFATDEEALDGRP